MKPLGDFVDAFRAHLAAAAALPVWELATLLTLPLLLLHAGEEWYFKVLLVLLCVPALLLPGLRSRSTLWLAVSVVLLFGYFNRWYSMDNHKFLTGYWALGLYCAALSKDPAAGIRVQARWLIGLCFLFATVWKLITPDYLDARHFEVALLSDSRFEGVAATAGGMSRQDLRANRESVTRLASWNGTEEKVTLRKNDRVRRIAVLLTWWTLAIEGGIAVAFLVPAGWAPARLRHPALLVFLFTTYAIAHVVGYGWLLAIMGVVLTPDDRPRTRVLYFAAMACLYLFMIPDASRA